jgi:hypothetical protein
MPYLLPGLFFENEVESADGEDPTLRIVHAWYRFSNWRFAWLNRLGYTKELLETLREETKAVMVGIVNAMPDGHSESGFRFNKFHSLQHFWDIILEMGSVQVRWAHTKCMP